MTSDGLVEMFEGDFADSCGGKFVLMSMGGRAEGLACADPGERTPIDVSGKLTVLRSVKIVDHVAIFRAIKFSRLDHFMGLETVHL